MADGSRHTDVAADQVALEQSSYAWLPRRPSRQALGEPVG